MSYTLPVELTELNCGKCGAPMEAGFGIDKDTGSVQPSRWLKGNPESSWWQGTDVKGRECRAIVMWRCTQCGFLESYAVQPVPAPGLFQR